MNNEIGDILEILEITYDNTIGENSLNREYCKKDKIKLSNILVDLHIQLGG